MPDGALSLGFLLEGDIARLRIPERGPGDRRDELWRHTCFEAFIARGQQPGYVELNLSPSGDWAVYQFTGYRAGMAPSDGFGTPRISAHADSGRLQLEARFAAAALSAPGVAGGLAELDAPRVAGALGEFDGPRVALAAVIEAEDGRLSYWALRHPPGKPDFHHPDGFVLGIEA